MTTTIIEIHPKSAELDPLAKQVQAELLEAGQPRKDAAVETQRLFRIEGNLDRAGAQTIADTLLVDPVVETVVIESAAEGKKSKAKKAAGGFVLDVWPKPGVTDPVGETVQKGIGDLGFAGSFHASSAQRYVFPKIKDARVIEDLARKTLANELIHDIHIRKI